MASCEWESCKKRDVYTLPRDSRPNIRSSQFEFRTYELHEWKHRALHDTTLEHSLRNSVCCFKRNLATSPDYPHTCFIADANNSVRLPPHCDQGMNLHPCICRIKQPQQMYCDGARVDGDMTPLCKNQALGHDIECMRDNRKVTQTNTVSMNIPGGCSLAHDT